VTVVVVDTSVYVSALVFGGVPRATLHKALRPPYQLAVSREIEGELAETLNQKFGWPEERIASIDALLWTEALWCKPATVEAARDPNDNHVLGCALTAQAEFLITGDKDLLVLHPFGTIALVTPAQFLALHTVAREPGHDV
jgi:putative PIN family toxin of toxin-antitoxin system